MYKKSYYNVFTDELNQQGDSVVYCTRSAEAILLTKSVRASLESEDFESIPDSVLNELIKYKSIVPSEEDELRTIISENNATIDNNSQLYEVIQPAAGCQLGCDYCGQTHTKDNIKTHLYDNLINRIRYKAEQKVYTTLMIGWFGGEPLMALPQMRELTPRLIALANEFGMRYDCKLVTNGLSLKLPIYVELAKKLKVSSIEVTLDGVAEHHDKRRHTKEGRSTFDIIFNNLLNIIHSKEYDELGCRISLRCNVDERNWEGVSPLIELLAKHDAHKKLSYFYPIGVYSWGGNDAHTKSMTKEEFAEKEIDWIMEMISAGFKPGLLPGRVRQVCLSVSPVSEMYDAFGNIFNCTEVSYTPVYENTDYLLGNLKDNPDFKAAARPLTNWNNEVLEGGFPCTTCKMLPVCGGACPKSWKEDMRACPSSKFNIKEKLALAYVDAKFNLVNVLQAESML